mmetsp:Transcript_5250/g.15267  ORF Transcript_5250/g.15267 Transcript_5250/m.15267 type:complete len:111 (+) Transcript_5250:601-933(+)
MSAGISEKNQCSWNYTTMGRLLRLVTGASVTKSLVNQTIQFGGTLVQSYSICTRHTKELPIGFSKLRKSLTTPPALVLTSNVPIDDFDRLCSPQFVCERTHNQEFFCTTS